MSIVVGILRSGVLFWCASTVAAAAGIEAQERNRDALRQIVQEECVIHWLRQSRPTPCESVSLSDSQHEDEGYAVLADIKGGAHFLLIPTKTIAGIESPEVLAPHAPNYFAAAWQAREDMAAILGRPVARDHVGLAVNSERARTQDQLHIHIECLGPEIYRVLKASADRLSDAWSPIDLAGQPYQGLRMMGENLDMVNPFRLLAERMRGAREEMGAYTLLVAGMKFRDGSGFIVLTGKYVAGAETYLDSSCAIAAFNRHK
jgi:CDP-diacylglycerol pyrophosphatase